ncbi:DNA primase large subunit, putative [Theileria annulata]|uniref:DNA primase large subunit n=1 Tax=Theileria annulata TaxID=5874 RepID=Q4UC16_THEAN|nr:DNA primase large subunit, putative [Theileria annulata]CAI75635.1 DNA primase large subunit, putative [Theileria annulata]|eukprot:XP_955111.1 DNA primase large subunit, putative [Theileria annulata]
MSIIFENNNENEIYLNCFYKGYKHVLTFYNKPPLSGEIDLRSFQEIAAKRLALLQYIDMRSELKIKSHKSKEFEPLKYDQKTMERMNEIEDKILEFDLMLPKVLYSKEELNEFIHIAQRDVISHFILRMAYILHIIYTNRDKDKTDWFIKNECKLFDIRLERLRSVKVQEVDGVDKLESFLHNQGIKYPTVKNPAITKGRHMTKELIDFTDLIRFRSDFNSIDKLYQVIHTIITLVPFYPDANQLVRMRLVSIKNSVAYVPPNSLFIVISTKFRNELQQSMKYLNENQSMLDSIILNDERLCDFMKVLPESYLANDYSKITFTDDTRLTLSNINQVYKFTFPPCMRRMFSHLLKNHHLKHEGRQQLWLFLKGLWINYGRITTIKSHAYNIRHLYGKEGKRTSYPPYSCTRMIKNSPPNVAGTAHGCPFKELDPKSLYQLLQEFGLNSTQIEPIIDLKSSYQFQLACVEYFNQTTPNSCADGIGTSPNTFFHSSFKAKFLKNKSQDYEQSQ